MYLTVLLLSSSHASHTYTAKLNAASKTMNVKMFCDTL